MSHKRSTVIFTAVFHPNLVDHRRCRCTTDSLHCAMFERPEVTEALWQKEQSTAVASDVPKQPTAVLPMPMF